MYSFQKMEFGCSFCPKRYANKQKLNDHLMKTHQVNGRKTRTANYDCIICSSSFNQCSSVFRHIRDIHKCVSPLKCVYCPRVFGCRETLTQHVDVNHNLIRKENKTDGGDEIQFVTQQHATKKFFQSYRIDIRQQLGLTSVMECFRSKIQSFMKKKFAEHGAIKVQFSIFTSSIKPVDETKVSCHASSNSRHFFLS